MEDAFQDSFSELATVTTFRTFCVISFNLHSCSYFVFIYVVLSYAVVVCIHCAVISPTPSSSKYIAHLL